MASSPPNFDPFDMWRKALNQFEENMNNLGTQSLKSDEVTKSLLQAGTMSTQMQNMMRKSLDRYFKTINLPTRDEITALAEALERIEHKLGMLLPEEEKPQIPRPSRTRRPASESAAAQTAPEPAPAPKAPAIEQAESKPAPMPAPAPQKAPESVAAKAKGSAPAKPGQKKG